MSSQLILVTGANGFVGAHVVHQLLEAGYRVRGTARGAKVELVRQFFAPYGKQFEVVNVNDIAIDDISEHLVGVHAVLHVAAPLPYDTISAQQMLDGAIQGTMNVIVQAEKAGIKRVVYTSSMVTVYGSPNQKWSDKDWNSITREDALASSESFMHYIAAKTLAEHAVHEWADKNKHVDITVLNAPWMFGPLAPGVFQPKKDLSALSTNIHILHFITGASSFPGGPGYTDVREVAKMHVNALKSPLESVVGRKRILISSPIDLDYAEAVRYLIKARPELNDRIVDPSTAPKFDMYRMPVDVQRIADVLDFKVDEYRPWQETILDTIDSLLALEKQW